MTTSFRAPALLVLAGAAVLVGPAAAQDQGTAVLRPQRRDIPESGSFVLPQSLFDGRMPAYGGFEIWTGDPLGDAEQDTLFDPLGQPAGPEASTWVKVRGTGALVPLYLLPGGSARVEVVRRSGEAPQVAGVLDGSGLPVDFQVQRATADRVVLGRLPVGYDGMLQVYVTGTYGEDSTFSVSARPDHRDVGFRDLPVRSPWESGYLVCTGPGGVDISEVLGFLGLTQRSDHGDFQLFDISPGREGAELQDALWLGSLLGPSFGFEPDARTQIPSGSQKNGVVWGSDLGRSDFARQKALRQIRAHVAQRHVTGAGVVVAVLDTGVSAGHESLAGRVLPGIDLVDGDDDPSEESDLVDDDEDGDVDEGYGHGTFVAGAILAVAPDARILPVRILDTDGEGTASRVATGIRYAVDRGAQVINLSLGARAYSQTLARAVREATERGVILVAAAGNDGERGRVDFPGSLGGVLAVTALGRKGRRAGYANGRRASTVAAPGVEIVGPFVDGGWARATGTSFSTALASGSAALALEHEPGLPVADLAERISVGGRLLLRRTGQ